MFPLRDTVRNYSFPIVNITLILANTVVFIFENTLPGSELNRFILNFGLVPARLSPANTGGWLADPRLLVTLITHMFIHGGWFHFLSNIWILYIFGDNIEDRMGSVRYLGFYLCAGIVAGLLQSGLTPTSQVPAIGASGAIAGVLGAYMVLYPGARVVTLVMLVIFPWFVELPALVYIGFWFLSQLVSGLSALSLNRAGYLGGVAWWAHIGGFLFGVFFFRWFTPRIHPAYRRRFPDQFITD